MIPYGKQSIDKIDVDAVIEVLESDYLTQGPKLPLFEKKITGMLKSASKFFNVAISFSSLPTTSKMIMSGKFKYAFEAKIKAAALLH